MTSFRSNKDEELKKLLKHSGEFRFDPNQVKYRLMSSIGQAEQKTIRHFKFSRVASYSVSFAALVIAISTTFAFASSSRPGDRLFALNKAGEGVIRSLPLPAQQQAQVEAYIVTQRFEALDQVEFKIDNSESIPVAKQLETVKESDETLNTAVTKITEQKKRLESRGKSKQAEKLESLLDQLQSQAEKQEKKIRELKDKTLDKETKEKIDRHLKHIEDSRKKAQAEIRRFQKDENN
jgi:hypothetical protein